MEAVWFKTFGKSVMMKKQPRNKYKLIQRQVLADPHWPYLGHTTVEN